MPSAIGRSKRPDSFGRSAGARLTVILRTGNSKPAFCSAARTRSRDFLDLGLGQADEIERRQAAAQMDFDRDQRRVEPREATRQDDGERHGSRTPHAMRNANALANSREPPRG